MGLKWVFVLLTASLLLSPCFAARASDSHANGNIVVRLNNGTSLEEAFVNITLYDLKLNVVQPEGYTGYKERFYGKFVLKNTGNDAETVVVSFPIYSAWNTGSGENFSVKVGGQETEYWDNNEGYGYSCGETRSNPSSRCNNDRALTDLLCYKAGCEKPECLAPYSESLRHALQRVFTLTLSPGESKEIEISYTAIGNGMVEYNFQDVHSWKRPIEKQVIVFNIEGGTASFNQARKPIENQLKSVEQHGNYLAYTWEFTDLEPTQFCDSKTLVISNRISFAVFPTILAPQEFWLVGAAIVFFIGLVALYLLKKFSRKLT